MVENKAKHIAAYSLPLELDGKSNERAVSAHQRASMGECAAPLSVAGLTVLPMGYRLMSQCEA